MRDDAVLEELNEAPEVLEIIRSARESEADKEEIGDGAFDLVGWSADGFVIHDPEDVGDDRVREDVGLGVTLGLKAGREQKKVFCLSLDDEDGRSLHFLFVEESEDSLRERVNEALKPLLERP